MSKNRLDRTRTAPHRTAPHRTAPHRTAPRNMAGLNVFVTRRFALNADFRYNMGMFATIPYDNYSITDDAAIGFSTSRVSVGFNWFPMGGAVGAGGAHSDIWTRGS